MLKDIFRKLVMLVKFLEGFKNFGSLKPFSSCPDQFHIYRFPQFCLNISIFELGGIGFSLQKENRHAMQIHNLQLIDLKPKPDLL